MHELIKTQERRKKRKKPRLEKVRANFKHYHGATNLGAVHSAKEFGAKISGAKVPGHRHVYVDGDVAPRPRH